MSDRDPDIRYSRRDTSMRDWEIIAAVIDDIPHSSLTASEMQAVFSFTQKCNELNYIEDQRTAAVRILQELKTAESPDADKLAFIRGRIEALNSQAGIITGSLAVDAASEPFRRLLPVCRAVYREREAAGRSAATRLMLDRHPDPASPPPHVDYIHISHRHYDPPLADEPAAAPKPSSKPEPWYDTVNWTKLCVVVLAVFIAFAAVIGRWMRTDASVPTEPTQTQQAAKPSAPSKVSAPVATEPRPVLRQLPLPDHGHIFEELTIDGVAPFSVSGSDNIYLVLDPIDLSASADNGAGWSQVSRDEDFMELRVFLRSGKSFETDVPLGEYEVYYATGDAWYGEEELFGPDTRYYKCDETFDFTMDSQGYNGWTLTLSAVYNGNLDTDSIDVSDFPK